MIANATFPVVNTVDTITRLVGCNRHQTEHVVRALDIKPAGRAGNCRLFSAEQAVLIVEELNRIRDGRPPIRN